jgi:opacity protein-like surface antigen
MIKSLLSSTALVFVLLVPCAGRAQSADDGSSASCPPGSWFCAAPPQQQATTAGQPLQPLPGPDDARTRESSRSGSSAPPPVVVYEPPPPTAIARPEAPPPYEYAHPRHPPISPPHEWGLNLHAEGAMIGSGTQGNAGMAGVGAGLRFKPTRSFGLEGDLDFAGGNHDYQGNKRSETAFSLNGLWFLNPRSHAQLYMLAGLGWAGAQIRCDNCSIVGESHYSYFGGQFGAGLELRLTRVLAFNLDIRGFIRGRTDDLARSQPEYDQPIGCSSQPGPNPGCRTTNTSGGGLLTGGMTLYF